MAFPSTPILDDGGRSDENPLSQLGLWSIPTGANAIQLTTGTFRSTDTSGANNFAIRGAYAPDQEAFFSIPSYAGEHGVLLCVHDSTGTAVVALATMNCYQAVFSSSGYFVYRVTNNSNSILINTTTWASKGLTWGDNVRCGARRAGSRFEVWFSETASGVWVQTDSVVDTTFSIGGAIGMRKTLTSQIDNFGGGDTAVNASPRRGMSSVS